MSFLRGVAEGAAFIASNKAASASSRAARRHGMAADAAPYVGLWGYRAPTADKTIFHCFVLLRDGTVISVPQKPVGRPT